MHIEKERLTKELPPSTTFQLPTANWQLPAASCLVASRRVTLAGFFGRVPRVTTLGISPFTTAVLVLAVCGITLQALTCEDENPRTRPLDRSVNQSNNQTINQSIKQAIDYRSITLHFSSLALTLSLSSAYQLSYTRVPASKSILYYGLLPGK